MCSGSVSNRSPGRVSSRVQAAQSLNSISALTLPASGPVPAGFAVLHGPLTSNVSALVHQMKKPVLRALASIGVDSRRFEQLSLRRMHNGIGAARYGALREVRISLLRALRLRSTAVPPPRSIHSCSHQRHKQYEIWPNLKYQHRIQPNSQSRRLVSLAGAWSQLRSSRTEVQFNQRANPSFKRTLSGWLRQPARSA